MPTRNPSVLRFDVTKLPVYLLYVNYPFRRELLRGFDCRFLSVFYCASSLCMWQLDRPSSVLTRYNKILVMLCHFILLLNGRIRTRLEDCSFI
jgi:hypothetical protein